MIIIAERGQKQGDIRRSHFKVQIHTFRAGGISYFGMINIFRRLCYNEQPMDKKA